MPRFTSKIFVITTTFVPTDHYLYRFRTPWKRSIKAPEAAATSLGSRHAPGANLSNYEAWHR